MSDVQSVIEDRLVRGEKLLVEAEIHPAIYWKSAVVGLFGLLFHIFVAPQLALLLYGTAALMAGHATLMRKILVLALTDKRVLARYGLLQIDVVDIRFDKVESLELEQMLLGYLFGYANVVVMGTGNRYIVIPFVKNGRVIRKRFNESVLED